MINGDLLVAAIFVAGVIAGVIQLIAWVMG